MIRRKVYILITLIAFTFSSVSIATVVLLNFTHKELRTKAISSIISTMDDHAKEGNVFMMKIISEKIKGLSANQQIRIIKKFIQPSEYEKTESYRKYVFDSNGKIIASVNTTEGAQQYLESQNKEMEMYFRSQIPNITKATDKVVSYSMIDDNEDLRIIIFTSIPETPFYHYIDFAIKDSKKALNFILSPFISLKKVYTWIFISASILILIIISFISIIILKQINEIEDEKKKKQLKIQEANTLLSVEVGIRERIEKELKIANKELKRLSARDGLTGIANRRCFDEYLQKEMDRMSRNSKPLSLILFDIDFFKNYNDTYGHQAGDDCLKKVAKTIESGARRPADLAARYGGEEFAIILPETDSDGAFFIADKIRKNIQNLNIEHTQSEADTAVTVSAGVSTIIPDCNIPPNEIINNADTALYTAKRSGRNRVEKQ